MRCKQRYADTGFCRIKESSFCLIIPLASLFCLMKQMCLRFIIIIFISVFQETTAYVIICFDISGIEVRINDPVYQRLCSERIENEETG